MAQEEVKIAVFGVELSDSESQTLRDALAAQALKDDVSLDGLLEIMLTHGIDATAADATGHHFNEGYPHAVGIEMGNSGYADVAKLVAKPPSKYQKRFGAELGALMASIGVTRRPRAILVEQTRAE